MITYGSLANTTSKIINSLIKLYDIMVLEQIVYSTDHQVIDTLSPICQPLIRAKQKRCNGSIVRNKLYHTAYASSSITTHYHKSSVRTATENFKYILQRYISDTFNKLHIYPCSIFQEKYISQCPH